MATGSRGEYLIAFESGHYKKFKGQWRGDSVWAHFETNHGSKIHVNKEKVEYIEQFGEPTSPAGASLLDEKIQAEIGVLKADAERTRRLTEEGK